MTPATCPVCSSAVAPEQRYCLGCGHRLAEPIVPWRAAVPRSPEPARAVPAARRVPRPKTAAALLLAALGTGTLLGAAAVPAPSAAGQGAPLIAYAPPAATVTPTPTPAPAPTPASSLPDDVPEAAAAPAEPAPEPAATPAPATQTSTDDDDEPAPPAAAAEPTPPPAKHVVIVSLTGRHFSTAFADDSTAPYLAHELTRQGTLLRRYHSVVGDAAAVALRELTAQMADAGRTWRAYVQGAPCTPGPRDPFAELADCATAEAPLATLETDLADVETAPSLAYVIPDGCHDGAFAPCPELDAGRDGLPRADAWLREWIPKITGSAAFADDGLLVVGFDGGRPDADRAKRAHVGAVVVSPFARTDAKSDRGYDQLSLLRTLAGTFGVDAPGEDVRPLGRDVFP